MHYPTDESFLAVEDLSVAFQRYDSTFEQADLKVISDLSISVNRGEILAIAGSSGSGKSLLAHAVMGLLPGNAKISGSIRLNGAELTPKRQKALRGKEMALVPQSVSYLDPLMRIGPQVRGTQKGVHVREKQRKLFKRYELDNTVEKLYPFQLSGGMARRVLVATAVISDAELIIADEPTPGMNLSQALEALKTFRELADQGKAIILITHDIDLAFEFADKVAVFYAGTTVEVAPSKDFIEGPSALRHPYSRALWNALPQNGFQPIPGFQPYAKFLPKGCLFAPRCPIKTAECDEKLPPMQEIRGGCVRCYHGA